MEQVQLLKTVYEKRQYEKAIDTTFTQLVPQQDTLITPTNLPTVDQFFDYYNQLFYDIPQTGTTNSHTYLIEQSTAYVGNIQNDTDVQALLDEIDQLRTENLQLTEELAQAQTTKTKQQAIQALNATG
jgi:hypothetical protein